MTDILTTDTTSTTDITESGYSFLLRTASNTHDMIKALVEEATRLNNNVEHHEVILGELSSDLEQRYKYLLQEQQVGDSELVDRHQMIEAQVRSLGYKIDKLETSQKVLEQRIVNNQKAFSYCLRKVEAAIERDPRNAYLVQVMDAIEDLGRKLD